MIRVTGMHSGLDTDLIIHELMRGHRAKVDTIKGNQISLQWKQDAWKELNTKALRLFNGVVNQMRFSDAYARKTSRVSSDKATVVTGQAAVNGVQRLTIDNLAKTGYLTGGEIKQTNGENVAATTQLSALGITEAGSFTVKSGSREREINIHGDMRVSDVVQQLRSAGVNANFDAANGRFFISSQTMGTAGDFSLTANNAEGLDALMKLGINYHNADNYTELAAVTAGSDKYNALVDAEAARLKGIEEAKLTAFENEFASLDGADGKIAARLAVYREYLEAAGETGVETMSNDAVVAAVTTRINAYNSEIESRENAIEAAKQALDPDAATYEDDKAAIVLLEEGLTAYKEENAATTALIKDNDITAYAIDVARRDELMTIISEQELVVANDGDFAAKATEKVDSDIAFAIWAVANGTSSGGATRIVGEDAQITLNGAVFTNSSNIFNINGLTITANQLTAAGEEITITTEDDTDGIYNMIKNFFSEYNALIIEMDRLYNANSARDFRPLTDEEKDAMRESEVEEWENKIKDSLLRRDSSLFNFSNAMKKAMNDGVTINGKTMRLSDFGIDVLPFFNAPQNERNAFFIDGDDDSLLGAGKPNILKEMIASNPQMVTDFFVALSRNLHTAMDKIILDRNSNFKSINTIYNDRQLQREYDNMTKAIERQEERINRIEDKYYKQFTAMEVAMAKMQSSQSAIMGLIGMPMR
ncbi:MAG: flagellar filament capping protein FliD [Lachnospiraceae bacterium]|nr:flagellar filament capping protein FliD [Lachnospiraceae bacterium]